MSFQMTRVATLHYIEEPSHTPNKLPQKRPVHNSDFGLIHLIESPDPCDIPFTPSDILSHTDSPPHITNNNNEL